MSQISQCQCRRERRKHTIEELAICIIRHGPRQCQPVGRCLGDGLAEGEGVAGPVVYCEEEMVRLSMRSVSASVRVQRKKVGSDRRPHPSTHRNGTRDRITALPHRLNRRGGAAMLEDDAQSREVAMQFQERGEEGLFGVQNRDVPARGAFAMEIQHHVLALHLLEDGVVRLVVEDAGGRIGSDAGGVGLDADDAGGFGGGDGAGVDRRVEIERHEEGDGGGDGLEAGAVGEAVGYCCYWGC